MSHRVVALLGGGAAVGAVFLYLNRRGGESIATLNLQLPIASSLVLKDREPQFRFDAFAACRGKVLGRSKVDGSYRGEPFDKMDCGEDAFFVMQNLLAVADGVGGWREHGVDPADFSNGLMRFTSQRALQAREGAPATPKQLLNEGYTALVRSKTVEAGASTAALAGLITNKEGQPRLITANLGDSGIIVVRDGAPVFRARQLQHRFNFPYQLQVPFSKRADQPSDAAAEVFALRTGDLVVVGSDGLFDNLFEEEVAAVAHTGDAKIDATAFAEKLTQAVAKDGASGVTASSDKRNAVNVIATGTTTSPRVAAAIGQRCRVDVAAKSLLARARETAMSKTAVVPFGLEAARAERSRAISGGKMDDISVVVGCVVPVAQQAQ